MHVGTNTMFLIKLLLMDTKIKHNILFFFDKEKKIGNDGITKIALEDGKLRMRIRWNSKVVNFNVGLRVKVKQWDASSQRCTRNTTNFAKQSASEINARIQHYENAAEDTFKAFELQEKMPEVAEFRDAMNLRLGKISKVKVANKNESFFDYLDAFTKEEGNKNDWTPATYQKFKAMKNHLLEFSPTLKFSFLNEEGLISYVHFLRDKKAMRNSTIKKQLSFLKWFLRWATEKKYNQETTFLTFKPKLKTAEKKVIFLSWEELMQLYSYKVPESKPYLQRVKDVFCFTCFTSLRYSDVANLKKHNVFDEHIEVVTVKTSDALKIELNDYSKEILEKYKSVDLPNDAALPVISNQRMNEYLKDLGEVAGIDEPVTITYFKGNKRYDEVHPKYALLGTHAGRRTFICNALMMGIPPQTVMKWTGHSDYKAMKPYIDIADKEKENAMKLFNKK